ncbi:antitoxin VbhA family protein [Sphingobium sp. AR-3-1]|uniref:Antitoxin VbhA family protein n=1 Tax=Sphingobium psychrophilum TaxID=2728834 RepID=A0A7X9X011_9SPHN|nr:antitoxin VbhA family protein [Sphingobium psychrophilum]NML13068.1 antitoxin VbhA family protein [Sphingobium psychrophilum]
MNDRLIPEEERAQRQRAIDFARTSTELSGGSFSPETEPLNARFVSGELSGSDYIAAVLDHANTLPPGVPVQEYFTSFDEAIKARDDSKGAS